jgi:hypothetical protein
VGISLPVNIANQFRAIVCQDDLPWLSVLECAGKVQAPVPADAQNRRAKRNGQVSSVPGEIKVDALRPINHGTDPAGNLRSGICGSVEDSQSKFIGFLNPLHQGSYGERCLLPLLPG